MKYRGYSLHKVVSNGMACDYFSGKPRFYSQPDYTLYQLNILWSSSVPPEFWDSTSGYAMPTCFDHHDNITRCTIWDTDGVYISYSKTNQMHNISNLFYFGTTLYMLRTVSSSIIRSLRLYIQHQVIQVLWLFAASSHRTCMTWCMYNLRLLIMDEETVRNMQSVVPK